MHFYSTLRTEFEDIR